MKMAFTSCLTACSPEGHASTFLLFDSKLGANLSLPVWFHLSATENVATVKQEYKQSKKKPNAFIRVNSYILVTEELKLLEIGPGKEEKGIEI